MSTSNITKNEFGRRLAAARTARRLTQEELARRIARPKNSVSEWERGVRLPSLDVVADIATALELSIDDLVRGDLESALARERVAGPGPGGLSDDEAQTVRESIQMATNRLRELARIAAAGRAAEFEDILDALAELRVAERIVAKEESEKDD